MNKIDIVILAGGLGKRMQTEIPKVLNELHGKPMISYILDAIKKSGVCEKPTIVVGKKREMVMEALGPNYNYVVQEEQLGTAHAVMCAESSLSTNNIPVLVLCGDMPNISSDTIKNIYETHVSSQATFTLATVSVPDFQEWRAGFFDFGRIVRDESGKIVKIVEKKDSSEEELKITEVNPFYFCFEPVWLWSRIHKINSSNAQKEFYLTDLVGVAVSEGVKISTVSINPKEALGVNTKEHLELLHNL